MGSILTRRNKSGTSYTASIRLKAEGAVVHSEAKTFPSKALAKAWMTAREAELAGQRARGEVTGSRMTVEQMIRWYREQERDDRQWGRSKRADLIRLQMGALAACRVDRLTSQDFISYINARRAAGAGPATAANDIIWLRQVFKAARLAMGVPVPLQALDDAATYLRQMRVTNKSRQRDRRPTAAELEALLAHFARRDSRSGTKIPMVPITLFALATARRQEEITRILWRDVNFDAGTYIVRDVKHPTDKQGNHREARALPPAIALIKAQPRVDERVFPYDAKSISAAWTRACHVLGIEDLHFHDLRHEATSRLFEAGYSIQEVAMFTLHDRWATLKRYANLRPADVPDRITAKPKPNTEADARQADSSPAEPAG